MKKPIILCIMDGYGIAPSGKGNCIAEAKKPNLERIFKEYPYTLIRASGEAVGLPDGQMGNSEVGHLNIGAGHIVYQSLTLINKAVKDGTFYTNEKYLAAMENCKVNHKKLHVFGLMSNGGVHSHVNHICAMIKMAKMQGLKDVFIHAFMDGRDVDPQSGVTFLDQVQKTIDEEGIGHIATISGRYWAMDRDKNMDRVDVAYRVLVDQDGNSFDDYHQYLLDQYAYLPTTGKDPSDEFIIPGYNKNVDGRIGDGDSIIFMNFRPDRAIQISTLFTNPDFYAHPATKADGSLAWKPYYPGHPLKDIHLVCTMKYADSVKGSIAFALPKMENTLGVFLANNNYTQLRIAETEKYAHVTFFFNGGEEKQYKGEDRILIPSPKVQTYDLKPEMSAIEVTDKVVEAINSDKYNCIILNYANPDMVGHTGSLEAAIKAIETIDGCVERVVEAMKQKQGIILMTADHGNAEQMIDYKTGEPHTAHTTNPVPLVLIGMQGVKLKEGKLADLAPTMLDIIGLEKPEEMTGNSLIEK